MISISSMRFNWRNSFEAEVHLNEFGASDVPACWIFAGLRLRLQQVIVCGQTIIYQETHCVAKGDDCCSIIGKPLKEWENAEELTQFMSSDPVSDELIMLQAELNELKEYLQQCRSRLHHVQFGWRIGSLPQCVRFAEKGGQ